MHYLPVELDVRGRPVLLLGGGESLMSKLDRLLAAEAVVTLYRCGAVLSPPLAALVDVAGIVSEPGEPSESALESAVAIFAAADVEGVDRWHLWARRSGRLFCAIDDAERSTFASPAIGDAGGMGVRFFSGGASPGLAKKLRDDVTSALARDPFPRFVAALGALRATLTPGSRAARMREAIDGFEVTLEVRFPRWFASGDSEPSR